MIVHGQLSGKDFEIFCLLYYTSVVIRLSYKNLKNLKRSQFNQVYLNKKRKKSNFWEEFLKYSTTSIL
ncbi:hypothetical protein BpHYR1_007191 [Brachionus plicatilis]|uniref:Uncharacterized protein n=1 Tax=Brachionus plicatilis TaxID=10195 RepID=A0A3M7QYA2_BRAPC|nr:hypothetical protein BpHYR1_007191 [Brachionus plicatilis]